MGETYIYKQRYTWTFSFLIFQTVLDVVRQLSLFETTHQPQSLSPLLLSSLFLFREIYEDLGKKGSSYKNWIY